MNKKIINIGLVIVLSFALTSCIKLPQLLTMMIASGTLTNSQSKSKTTNNEKTTAMTLLESLGILYPSISGFNPTSGKPGDVVTITGTNFTNVTGVKFNGVDATKFTLEGNTINATVPDGDTTGGLSVITNSVIINSLYTFIRFPVWTQQFGTKEEDQCNRVTVDNSGAIYVAGSTWGSLDGNINRGSSDAFLIKSDTNGNKQWIRQFGTNALDRSSGISVDNSGNTYVTGYTEGNLDGNVNQGGSDIILVKYDTNGNKLWRKQFGSEKGDDANGIAVDNSDNIYITGYTEGNLDGNINQGRSDIFLVKYDTNGNKQWTTQLGTNEVDSGNGVAVDNSGNIYVTGYTNGNLDGNVNQGGSDIFLAKYDTNGNKQWTTQLGAKGYNNRSYDVGNSVSVDNSENIYVTGYTQWNFGSITLGSNDAFLIKYDTKGNQQWIKQFGSEKSDIGHGVSVDKTGNIYVSGETFGNLDGRINQGESDIFIVKYDTNGNKQWTKQLGSEKYDNGSAVAIDNSGNLYITGVTKGNLDGNINQGENDIFLMKLRL